MYFTRGQNLSIPENITKNIMLDQVKNTINEFFNITLLEIDPTAPENFGARPSYRDLMAFIFQPQNIIANNSVMFYNIEKIEHKKRLINILPYVLGAVTAEVLMAIQERETLMREKLRIERELKNIKDISESWKQEISEWLSQARELGLTKFDSELDFSLQIAELKQITAKNENDTTIESTNVRDISETLSKLREEEQTLSRELSFAQKRYDTMKSLDEAKKKYNNSLTIQRNRLDISGWLRSLAVNDLCPLCRETHDNQNKILDELCEAMSKIEREAGVVQGISIGFDREFALVKANIDILSEKLSALRKRIQTESDISQEGSILKYTLTGAARFLGRMDFAIKTYEHLGTDSELEERLAALNTRIDVLRKLINENSKEKKMETVLEYIQQQANTIIKQLLDDNAEHYNDPIKFEKNELTIKITTVNGRENYLWEIGSASNWLSYHIAISLAFQKFFQKSKDVAIPNILVLDQPSQVYFPYQTIEANTTAQEDLTKITDEDKVAVKKIFSALSRYITDTKEPLQIIVLEHADQDIWGEYKNIYLVDRWRDGNKLVPQSWISENK
jgi:ribosomal protein S15P/S13E